MKQRTCTLLGLLLLVGPGSVALADGLPESVGEIFLAVPGSTDVVESRGREVADGELIRTVNDGAVVRLDNGQVLLLAANTAVAMESLPANAVLVRLLSGRVSLVGNGEVHHVGAPSHFTLRAAELDAASAEAMLLDPPPVARDGERATREGRRARSGLR